MKGIMLSGISQKETNTILLSLIYMESKKHSKLVSITKKAHSQIQRTMVISGEREGGKGNIRVEE